MNDKSLTTKEEIEHYKTIANEIESYINKSEIEKAEMLLNDYKIEISNSKACAFEAIITMQKGDVVGASKILEIGIEKHPFNFSLHFNLAFIYGVLNEFIKSFENYFYAIKYSLTDQEREMAFNSIKELTKLALKEKVFNPKELQKELDRLKKIISQADARIYPIDINGDSIVRKPQRIETTGEYMVNMHNTLNITDVDLQTRMLFSSELINGKMVEEEKNIETICPVIVPISSIKGMEKITVTVNNKNHVFKEEHLPLNQFNYIRISEPGQINISADKPIFIGNPVELKQDSEKPKLVMKIFIDGLSFKFLEDMGIENAMPHTFEFFKKGMIAKNCNTVSEWTLPSMASINTGIYATKHKILQPELYKTFNKSHKLLAEYFKEAGFYCTDISGNWRTTPALGYHRGYDRIIYKNFLGGFGAKEVLMEAIEHLGSFSDTNNFLSLSLMDLHNVPDEIEKHLYSQVHTDINSKINECSKGLTSVQTKYDKNKISKYLNEIKRVDHLLSVLYSYLISNYDDDDFIISLHSDHGQSFLSDTFDLLGDTRIKVPFMIRGRGIEDNITEEFIETIDILPSLLHCSGMGAVREIDGQVPVSLGGKVKRKYTFTQIIHPKQPYKARIKEKEVSYYMETKYQVHTDLSINLEDFKSKIIDNYSGLDITTQYKEKREQYDRLVFEHIKSFIRWD